MDDKQRLSQLLRARHPCILIPTHEEDHALALIRDVALDAGALELRIWSYSRGVYNGLLEGDRPVADTEPPAAGLYYLLNHGAPGLVVLIDLVEHLSDARVLRLLRELVECQRSVRGHVILLD